jgi:hypothetical protein
MSEIWLLIAAIFAMLTLSVVFFGAPYVPTRARDMDKLFAAARLKKSDVLVDLGSGDGRLLLAAATRGIKSVGVELNPLLVVITWWRLRNIRQLASVRYTNFWRYRLPSDTTCVFVFLAEPFMERLRRYLESESKRLGHPITLVSYGFSLPGYKPVRTADAVLVYEIQP